MAKTNVNRREAMKTIAAIVAAGPTVATPVSAASPGVAKNSTELDFLLRGVRKENITYVSAQEVNRAYKAAQDATLAANSRLGLQAQESGCKPIPNAIGENIAGYGAITQERMQQLQRQAMEARAKSQAPDGRLSPEEAKALQQEAMRLFAQGQQQCNEPSAMAKTGDGLSDKLGNSYYPIQRAAFGLQQQGAHAAVVEVDIPGETIQRRVVVMDETKANAAGVKLTPFTKFADDYAALRMGPGNAARARQDEAARLEQLKRGAVPAR